MPISLLGRVTKAGFMDKTVTVSVDRMVRHARTHKMVKRTTKMLTHDPKNVLRSEDLVRIRSCPRKSLRKHFELEIVIRRGWEGKEFDRMYPRKAAPLLTSLVELEALSRQHAEVKQALQVLSMENETKKKPLTDETQSTGLGQTQTPVEGVVEPEVPGIGVEQR